MAAAPDVAAPAVGDPAPDLELRDDAGRPARLAALWQAQPLLLFFARHFG